VIGAHQGCIFSSLEPLRNPTDFPLPSAGRAIITLSIFLSISQSEAIVEGINVFDDPHTPIQMMQVPFWMASIYSACLSFKATSGLRPLFAFANFSLAS